MRSGVFLAALVTFAVAGARAPAQGVPLKAATAQPTNGVLAPSAASSANAPPSTSGAPATNAPAPPATTVSTPPASSAPPAPSTPRGDRVPGEGSGAPSPAQPHFERALTWYRAGNYRRALDELNLALARDPQGKDLVFNLALVQEKIGDLDGAIQSLERFQVMEKDAKELERASQTIERLRGARAALAAAEKPPRVSTQLQPCPAPRARGRLDKWVIGSGGLALASFLVGGAFAVRALTESESASARDSALISDLAFAASLLAGVGSVALYWGRSADLPAARGAQLNRAAHIVGAGFQLRY